MDKWSGWCLSRHHVCRQRCTWKKGHQTFLQRGFWWSDNRWEGGMQQRVVKKNACGSALGQKPPHEAGFLFWGGAKSPICGSVFENKTVFPCPVDHSESVECHRSVKHWHFPLRDQDTPEETHQHRCHIHREMLTAAGDLTVTETMARNVYLYSVIQTRGNSERFTKA